MMAAIKRHERVEEEKEEERIEKAVMELKEATVEGRRQGEEEKENGGQMKNSVWRKPVTWRRKSWLLRGGVCMNGKRKRSAGRRTR